MLEENSTYQLDGKNLKYGENKTNHIFTIDNTNVLKKKRSQLSKNLATYMTHLNVAVASFFDSFGNYERFFRTFILSIVNI